jgi:hypothetical protein
VRSTLLDVATAKKSDDLAAAFARGDIDLSELNARAAEVGAAATSVDARRAGSAAPAEPANA